MDGTPLDRLGRWQRQEDHDCAERRAAQAGRVSVSVYALSLCTVLFVFMACLLGSVPIHRSCLTTVNVHSRYIAEPA